MKVLNWSQLSHQGIMGHRNPRIYVRWRDEWNLPITEQTFPWALKLTPDIAAIEQLVSLAGHSSGAETIKCWNIEHHNPISGRKFFTLECFRHSHSWKLMFTGFSNMLLGRGTRDVYPTNASRFAVVHQYEKGTILTNRRITQVKVFLCLGWDPGHECL